MNRFYQITLSVSTLALCWLGMQIVHETGHVLAAWVCGERVDRVVLNPLTIARTDTTHDRHPLIVIWCGPIIGALLPLCVLVLSKLARPGLTYLFRFFAGFCLISNGAYLGVGSFEGVGDAGDLLRYGASRWTLIAFGVLCVPGGLFLWHGLGPHFGLGEARGRVDRRGALGTFGFLLAVVLIELIVDSRW